MSTWNREQTLNFINLYEQHPFLYKASDVDHRNRIKTSRCLTEISEKLQQCRPKTVPKDLVLKLKTLKTQFLKEKNKINSSKRSGAGTNELYIPTLWCFEELQFLDDTNDNICGTSNIPSLVSEEVQEVFEEASHQAQDNTEASTSLQNPAVSHSRKKQRRITQLEISAEEAVKAANKIVNTIANKPVSISTLQPFLNHLESELNVLKNDDLLTETKWDLLEVVRQAQGKQKLLNGNITLVPTRVSSNESFKTNDGAIVQTYFPSQTIADEDEEESMSHLIEYAMEDVFDETDFEC